MLRAMSRYTNRQVVFCNLCLFPILKPRKTLVVRSSHDLKHTVLIPLIKELVNITEFLILLRCHAWEFTKASVL